MLKDNLRGYIYTALLSLHTKKEKKDIQIDTQQHSKFGDYSTNIAFCVGKNPIEFAEKIKDEILKANHSSVKSIEVAGGGFINFYLHDEFFCVKKNTPPSTGDIQALQPEANTTPSKKAPV